MMKGTSLYELLHPHRRHHDGKVAPNEANKRITDGITRQPYPSKEGYHIATPAELLSLLIPIQAVEDGKVIGFQRELNIRRARTIARAVEAGEPLPTIEVGLHGKGAWITDGQHRAAAAVVANVAVPTLARRQDEDTMRKLFANQAKGARVNPSVLVLSADDAFSEYIQDAVTDDSHPWAALVTHQPSSKVKLTPSQARGVLIPYVTNSIGMGATVATSQALHKLPFDAQRALDLGRMLLSYGGREANPMAYRAVNLRATVQAMIRVIIRHEHESPEAIDRWTRHMVKMEYSRYAHVTSVFDMTSILVSHWNKRLAPEKRVPMEAM